MLRRIARLWASVGRSESGSTMVLFTLVFPLVAMIGGGAVDLLRWHNAKRHTAGALDAAVLAGARYLLTHPEDSLGAERAALAFYKASIAGRGDVTNDTISFKVSGDKTSIAAEGGARMRTSFLGIAGISSLDIVGGSEAGLPSAKLTSGGGGSNLEIAVMLDVTGSMCADANGPCSSSTKLDALKEATKELVNVVLADTSGSYTARIGLVPFSTRVRVAEDGGGAAIMKAMTNMDAKWSGWFHECIEGSYTGTSEGGGTWTCTKEKIEKKKYWKLSPCVTDRFYDNGWAYDYTDAAPGAGAWMNLRDGSRIPYSWDSSDTRATSQTGKGKADPMATWNYTPNGECWEPTANNILMPLTADKAELNARIDALEAYGSTSGALGTAFSWYLLSPNWASVWPSGSGAGPYADVKEIQANGAPKLRKIAILMSDGVYNTFRGWKDQDQQTVSNYAKQLCTNMKAQGIEIFTVAFALNELSGAERKIAEDTLRSCGTDIPHFYDPLTTSELKQAFNDIAVRLSTISLSR